MSLADGIDEMVTGCLRTAAIVAVLGACMAGLLGYSVGSIGMRTKGSNTMVKVSSSGPVKTRKVVCSKCAYELEYTGEDVKSSVGFIMGESDTSYYIVCPRESCQTRTTVKVWQ